MTDLHDAVNDGNIEAVKAFLSQKRVNVNAVDKVGWTPLFCAAAAQYVEIFLTLLDSGADVKAQSNVDGTTVLHALADIRHGLKPQDPIPEFVEMWKAVLQHKEAPINTPNHAGETPLHLCALRNNIWAVELLLSQSSIAVNPRNKVNETPLHYASRKGYKEVIELLVKHGGDVTIAGQHGTSQDVAVDFGQNEIAKLLDKMKKQQNTPFLVPYEVQLKIFDYLNPTDLCCLSMTCRMFSITAADDSVWKKFGKDEWAVDTTTSAKSNNNNNSNSSSNTKTEWRSSSFWKKRYLAWIRQQVALYRLGNRLSWLTSSQLEQQQVTPPVSAPKISPPGTNADYDHLFKLLMIGDSGAGKSSFLMRFSEDTFTDSYISTIGVDFKINRITIDDKIVKLQIWDTAGPERFRTITSAYYRGAHGIFVMYDITNRTTFDHLKNWLEEITKHALEQVCVIVIGCKADQEAKRQVTLEEAQQFCAAYNVLVVETSSKTDLNVRDAVSELAAQILSKATGKSQRSFFASMYPKYVPTIEDFNRMLILEVAETKALNTNSATTKVPPFNYITIGDYAFQIVRQKTLEEINLPPLQVVLKSADQKNPSKCILQ